MELTDPVWVANQVKQDQVCGIVCSDRLLDVSFIGCCGHRLIAASQVSSPDVSEVIKQLLIRLAMFMTQETQ